MTRAAELLRAVAEHVMAHPDDPEQWWISDFGEAHGYDRKSIVAAISARDLIPPSRGNDAIGYASILRMAALKVSGVAR